MKQLPELWLVRHGETAWSRSGRHTGWSDIPLTAQGRADVKRLAPVLAAQSFDQVWRSPLSRARETAELVGFGTRAACLDDLREWDYGEYEGRSTDGIRRTQPDFNIWTARINRGETLSEVSERTAHAIQRAVAAGGRSLLIGHGHALRILAANWLGLAPLTGRFLALDAASVSILHYEQETRVIRLWNRTAK